MRNTHAVCLWMLFAALALVPACGRRPAPPGSAKMPVASEPVTLKAFIPCGMTAPFHEAIERFQAENPTVTVEGVYENDAKLLELVIDKGERPDLFVSPGGREVDLLAAKGLIDEGATTGIGSYRLVAVVRRKSDIKAESPEALATDAVKSIALPSTETSSVGWYTRQSLEKLGLWDAVEPKLVKASRLIDAFDKVLNEEADLTFVYKGCPLPTDPKLLASHRARIAFELPLESYDEPRVIVGLLNTSAHAEAARAFMGFLAAEDVVALMVANKLPDERGTVKVTSAQAKGSATVPAVPSDGMVHIEAFYPDDDRHAEVRAFLNGLEGKYPGKVTVALYEYKPDKDPEGYRKWLQAGFGCAGILINGKNEFALGTGEEARSVAFQRKMDVSWTKEDLIAAVEQELGAASP